MQTREVRSAPIARATNKPTVGILQSRQQSSLDFSDTGLALLKNAQGALEVLTIAPDRTVVHLTPSPTQDGTWVANPTKIKSRALAYDADVRDGNENAIFSVADASGPFELQFEQITYQPETGQLLASSVPGGGIRSNPPPESVDSFNIIRSTQDRQRFELYAGIRRRRDADPVFAMAEVGPGARQLPSVAWAWWAPFNPGPRNQLLRTSTSVVFPAAVLGGGSDQTFLTLFEGRPRFLSGSTIRSTRFYEYLNIQFQTSVLGELPPIAATSLAFAGPYGAPPVVFVVATDNTVRMVEALPPLPGSGFYTWPRSWTVVDTSAPLGPTRKFVKMFAYRASPAGPIDLFLVDQESNLWHTRRTASGEWERIVDLGIVASSLAAGYEGEDPDVPTALTVFAADPTARTPRLTRLQRTADGGWDVQEISIVNPATMAFERRNELSARVQFNDPAGAPLAGARIGVTSSDDRSARVNGQVVLLTSNVAYEAVTDSAGQIAIRTDVINELGAPTFSFSSAELAGGALEVTPNSNIRSLFTSVTGERLRNAVDPETGKPILPRGKPDSFYNGAATALATSMTSVAQFYEEVPRAGQPVCIAPLGQELAVTPLDRAEFERGWSRAQENLDAFRETLSDQGILGIQWGDIWQAIRKAVLQPLRICIAEGRVTIELAGGILGFEISAASQGFDIAWWALEYHGAVYLPSFNWLLNLFDSFIDWPTVVKNKNMIRQMFRNEINGLVAGLPRPSSLRPELDSFLQQVDTLKNEIEQRIRQVLPPDMQTYAGAARGRSQWSDVQLPGGAPLMPWDAFSWLIDEILGALPNLDILPPFSAKALETQFNRLLGDITADVENTVDGIVQPILDHVRTVTTSPSRLTESSIAGLAGAIAIPAIDGTVALVRDLAEDGLSVADAAVDSAGAVLDWTDAELKLPFLADFYALVLDASGQGGNRLSLLDLVALVGAIPVTAAVGGELKPGDLLGQGRVRGSAATIAFSVLAAVFEGLELVTGAVIDAVSLALGAKLGRVLNVLLETVRFLFGFAAGLFALLAAKGLQPASMRFRGMAETGLIVRVGFLLLTLLGLKATDAEQKTVAVGKSLLSAAVGGEIIVFGVLSAMAAVEESDATTKASDALVATSQFLGALGLFVGVTAPVVGTVLGKDPRAIAIYVLARRGPGLIAWIVNAVNLGLLNAAKKEAAPVAA